MKSYFVCVCDGIYSFHGRSCIKVSYQQRFAVLVYAIKYFDYISWQLQPGLDEEDSLVNTQIVHTAHDFIPLLLIRVCA